MIRLKLTDKEVKKISSALSLSEEEVYKLNGYGFLNVSDIVNELVKRDFNKLVNSTQFSKIQVVTALANEYDLSTSTIQTIIYNKNKHAIYRCKQCHGTMTRYKHTKNKGVCDACIVSKIEL